MPILFESLKSRMQAILKVVKNEPVELKLAKMELKDIVSSARKMGGTQFNTLVQSNITNLDNEAPKKDETKPSKRKSKRTSKKKRSRD